MPSLKPRVVYKDGRVQAERQWTVRLGLLSASGSCCDCAADTLGTSWMCRQVRP